MRTTIIRKAFYIWLGILAITIQSFMPVWQAYADERASENEPFGFANICYAFTEASKKPLNDSTPTNQPERADQCLLCQLPSFGNVIASPVQSPDYHAYPVLVQYFPPEQDCRPQATLHSQPPARAPPA